jgi:glycosyltransferase involved in cell wall biosynthesis
MNRVAARDLVTRYWPPARDSVPEANLVVVGRNPPDWLKSSVRDRIQVVGSPPDVRPYLWSAAALVALYEAGGGSKIKILEAMAAGTPVIATTQAMQGIPAVPGVHYLSVASPSAAAVAVRDLVRDRLRSGRVAAQAQEWIQGYDWAKIAAAAIAAMERAVANAKV